MNKKKINEDMLRNPAMPWNKEGIYGPELMGMRLLRKVSLKEMSKVTGEPVWYLKSIEEDNQHFIPPPIAGAYMQYLSCNMNHVYQFRNIVEGKQKTFQESRRIGAKLQKEVYKKCNNRCVVCMSDQKMHIHHIKEYAKGGLNELSNLVLLCAKCHADTHKDNQSFHMLKKLGEDD